MGHPRIPLATPHLDNATMILIFLEKTCRQKVFWFKSGILSAPSMTITPVKDRQRVAGFDLYRYQQTRFINFGLKEVEKTKQVANGQTGRRG